MYRDENDWKTYEYVGMSLKPYPVYADNEGWARYFDDVQKDALKFRENILLHKEGAYHLQQLERAVILFMEVVSVYRRAFPSELYVFSEDSSAGPIGKAIGKALGGTHYFKQIQ